MTACGARVYVCDLNEEALTRLAESLPVGFSRADVSVPDEVARLVDEAAASLDGVNVLVNNAGISGPIGPVDELLPEALRHTLAVNLESQFYCAAQAVPRIRDAGGGSIINISSIAGRLGYPSRAPYSASKWGVIGFTKSLAAELGQAGIRVNAVCPGAVDDEPLRASFKRRGDALGVPPAEVREQLLAQSSMRRFVTPADVAHLVAFLASDLADGISGQVIGVDADTTRLN